MTVEALFHMCIDELEIPTDSVLKVALKRASHSYLGITPFSNQSVEAIHERISGLKK